MKYWIILHSKTGYPYHFKDTIPDDIYPFEIMTSEIAEYLGMCSKCEEQCEHCHVFDSKTGIKYCPMLFVDTIEPHWQLSDIV